VDAEIVLGFPVGGYGPGLRRSLEEHLRQAGLEASLTLSLSASIPSSVANRSLQPLPGVANVIAIASGKGGVGKSTVTANLALALAQQGARVGVLDADIYGPSQPRMMGLAGQRPTTRDGKRMDPPSNYGVKVMSIGFMIDEQTPMVWRGPMVTQALVQLLSETNWGDLDYLFVDMPPGTGDTQLTLAQRVPVSGAVIVTTPQDIALLDARKGLMMFRKVEIPVLGVVENMSVHVCPACGHQSHVFGAGGGRAMAEEYGVALLGELPLELSIREQADAGHPTVVAEPDSPIAQAYGLVARRAAARLALAAVGAGAASPRITIEDDE
jgi:ATP-binding protein involved in chromosome partitioning